MLPYSLLMLWLYVVLFFFFGLFRAAPETYEGFQTRGPIRAVATSLRQSHSNAGSIAVSAAYTTAHGNAGSLTH